MKKFITIISIALAIVLLMSSCNMQLIDTTYSFERAILSLPDGTVINGKVTSWADFEDGDQIQVKIDGKTYLVHSSNIVLISE